MNFKLLVLFLALAGTAFAATEGPKAAPAKDGDIEADIDVLDDSIEKVIASAFGAAKAAAEKCHHGIGDLQQMPHDCQGMTDATTKCPSEACHERLSILTAHCTAELMGANIVAHLKVCNIDPANPDIELDLDSLNYDMELKRNDTTLDATKKAAVEKCHQGLDELEELPHECEEFTDKDTTCPSEKCHERLTVLAAHCTVELLGPNIVAHLKVCDIDPANPDLEFDLDSLNADLEIKLLDTALDATKKAAIEKCHTKLDELETQAHACEEFFDKDTTCPAGCKDRLTSLTQGCAADILGDGITAHLKVCAVGAASPGAGPVPPSAGVATKLTGAFFAGIVLAITL